MDFKVGTICSLTSRKPDFKKTCPNIEFAEKLEIILKEVNVEHKKVAKAKFGAYLNFWINTISGSIIIATGYFVGRYIFENGVYSKEPIFIISTGIPLLVLGFRTLVKYHQKKEVAEIKKRDVDNVLAEYGIEYEIEINFGKAYHGIQEITTDLLLKSKTEEKKRIYKK